MKERTVYTAGVNGLSFLPKKHPNALHNSKITQKCFKRIVKVVRCGFYFLYIKFCTFHSLTHTQSYWEMCPRWIGLMSFYLVYWWDWKIRILLSLQGWDIFLLLSIKYTRSPHIEYSIYIAVKIFHDGILATCGISTSII